MTIASLGNVLKTFRGSAPDPEARRQLVNEALLMTLARASIADTNVRPVEVSTIQRIMKEATGETVSSAEIRVSAHSELFETTSLGSALAKIRTALTSDDRALIASSLATVIKSDLRVSPFETQYFNEVARALEITPAELAGLVPPG